MLQQTTVQTVIPFWQRFMARFPNVASLAAADESDVLSLWTGLGYYTRARSLHRAARRIRDGHLGILPDSYDAWLALPGVGPYAAGAIASIGLGEPVPALDANARRVLSRWAITDPVALAGLSAGQRRRIVDDLGAELVPAAQAGKWNEALMELGALICGARRAACEICPVARHCHAVQGGWVEAVPVPTQRAQSENVWVGLVVFTWRDRVLLVPAQAGPLPGPWPGRSRARTDFSSLHLGLWGVPTSPWLAGSDSASIPWPNWRRELELPTGLWPAESTGKFLGRFKHAITRYRLWVSVYRVELDAQIELSDEWIGGVNDALGSGGDRLFCSFADQLPPLSSLAEKALHFHRNSDI